MKKLLLINTLVFTITLALFSSGRINNLSAASNFSSVEVFSGGGGFVKFFDKSTGKLYVYNRDLDQCVSIVQVEELGKPAKMIQAATSGETY